MDTRQSRNSLIETILRQVTPLPLRLRRRSHQPRIGQQRSGQRGVGLEFDQITTYQHGDAIHRINWAATARQDCQTLLVNTYYEEKDLTVLLVVDLSASMDFGSIRLTKRTLAAEIAASVVYSALRAHHRIGYIGLTAEIAQHLPPSLEPRYQRAIPELILHGTASPTAVDFSRLIPCLARHARPPALIFLLSDFLAVSLQPLEQMLTRLSRRHEIVALQLTDPLESTFPIGPARLTVRDLETQRLHAYALTRQNQQHLQDRAHAQTTQLRALLQRTGVAHLAVTPHSNYRSDLRRLFLADGRRGRV